ncbi:lysophospholipid acyltransferase family protein [Variovorax sp. J22R133]|uniref:lysophospholipid acyltransferase family protein n=1 Tax=Variovorax brevis TaxID=3053503 RepID=UPI0025772710|nr:lysophospholipid acyltransferase family protein [Variovorax sp. J22R133]MDM0111457.1 lysophospholipid acyltransferase family protein [Variovorax sp. J22R133]
MRRTIFETPVLEPLLRTLSRGTLRLLGWRVEGELSPRAARCVVIAAPHTSNWDFPFTLMAAFALGMHIRWLGKASLFPASIGWLMRWLGGIPVHRERSNNLVAASIEALKTAPGPLQLVMAPEGTRSRATQWKTGFHHIARGAGLPIQLSYLDWGNRRCGLGPLVEPGDDVEAEIASIRAFYAPIRGRNQDQFDAG